ncbi:Uncharacterized protein C14C4.04 [Taphrina deformans PYCC 5710]|uniref:Uncharacterized protein C14C4.04 n=1 Tax=Taphrina deformans (strain PYCC 5710 / ATCC 11124 / CBS 356.35 / IMI 108563 / JCM 9778 / NBRC 8474) TaxID=1097556 RepID=R4XDB5_TAPDE|nr:Uncharacterized protein C14C4.04 [Taphrina deformans PYCC 5710]|eukprot:CCG83583.1 Uncharacterized protein C14C4.04 [Taphrina deformans PYCC 5710]
MSLYTDPHQHKKLYQTTVPKPRDESKQRSPRACILLSSTGLEPKEVHSPWQYLTNHGFFIEFATWDGKPAKADSTLLEHTLWGSAYSLQSKWKDLISLDEWLKPHAWAPLATTSSQSAAGVSEIPKTTSTSNTQPLKPFEFENYDLILIPGGWASREHLEHDTILHEKLSRYCLNLPKDMGCKALAVIGDGISPLLHVKDPLTQEPILKNLTSTGPGYDSWSGMVTGNDLGSLVVPLVKHYVSKKVTIDPDYWYISSPSSNFDAEFNPALVTLVKGAVRVSEFRELERQSKRLSTVQSNQLKNAIEFDGLSKKQKERLNAEGIGKAESGFVMTNWSWGWRKNYN